MTIILILGLIAVAAFAGYVAFAYHETRRLHSYREWSDRFFSLSAKVLDHDVPVEWLDVIDGLNKALDSPTASRSLYEVYKAMGPNVAGSDPLPEAELAFVKSHPAVAEAFVWATRAGFIAISFNSAFTFGEKARALMAEQWTRKSVTSAAVREVEKVRRKFIPRVVPSAA